MKLKKCFILIILLITTICRPNGLQQQLTLLELNLRNLHAQIPAQVPILAVEKVVTKFFSLMEEVNTKTETILRELLKALQTYTILTNKNTLLKRINNELSPLVQELRTTLNQLPKNVQSNDEVQLAFYVLRQLERRYRKKLNTRLLLSKTLYEIDPQEALKLLPGGWFMSWFFGGYDTPLPTLFIFYEFDIAPIGIYLTEPLDPLKAKVEEKRKNFFRYEHPNKVPNITDPALKQKIKEYADKQFSTITTDLDLISRQEDDKIKNIIVLTQTVLRTIRELLEIPGHKDAADEVINALETLRSSLYTTVIETRFTLYEKQLIALAAGNIKSIISAMKDYLEGQDVAQQKLIKSRIQQTIHTFKQSLVDAIENLKKLLTPQQKIQAPALLARITAYEQAQIADPEILPSDDLHAKILQGKQWIKTVLGV